eukprot:Clim_evm11s12 gene=Clim_evmTU11s12
MKVISALLSHEPEFHVNDIDGTDLQTSASTVIIRIIAARVRPFNVAHYRSIKRNQGYGSVIHPGQEVVGSVVSSKVASIEAGDVVAAILSPSEPGHYGLGEYCLADVELVCPLPESLKPTLAAALLWDLVLCAQVYETLGTWMGPVYGRNGSANGNDQSQESEMISFTLVITAVDLLTALMIDTANRLGGSTVVVCRDSYEVSEVRKNAGSGIRLWNLKEIGGEEGLINTICNPDRNDHNGLRTPIFFGNGLKAETVARCSFFDSVWFLTERMEESFTKQAEALFHAKGVRLHYLNEEPIWAPRLGRYLRGGLRLLAQSDMATYEEIESLSVNETLRFLKDTAPRTIDADSDKHGGTLVKDTTLRQTPRTAVPGRAAGARKLYITEPITWAN